MFWWIYLFDDSLLLVTLIEVIERELDIWKSPRDVRVSLHVNQEKNLK